MFAESNDKNTVVIKIWITTALFINLLASCAVADSPETNTTNGLVPGRVTEVARGLDMPWGLTFLPDGSALVSGRSSEQIHHVPAEGGEATLVGGVPGVEQSAEGGLLGLATSPTLRTGRCSPTSPRRRRTGWLRSGSLRI